MRYLGGLLGGSWLTAMTGDLGGGKFDGAWLVTNFESGNPANTYWTKQYEVWADVDQAAERYLGFEKWWGGHVTLNAEEMQFIVDQLFVGNRLATGELTFSDGTRVDLRNIASPIIVFCSEGDDITPPAQALSWITDLYGDIDDLRTHGQTIVYSVHGSIGHLGIFVSGGVARKEHNEFASNMDMIDVLPPGLYEAVLQQAKGGLPGAELVEGDWLVGLRGARASPTSPRMAAPTPRTRSASPRRAACRRRTSRCTASSRSRRCARMATPPRRGGAGAAASGAAVLHAVLRPQPGDGLGRAGGRHGARQPPARRRPTIPAASAERQVSDGDRRALLDAYGRQRDALTERLFQAIYDSPVDAGADRRRGGRRAAAPAPGADAGPPALRRRSPTERLRAAHGRGRPARGGAARAALDAAADRPGRRALLRHDPPHPRGLWAARRCRCRTSSGSAPAVLHAADRRGAGARHAAAPAARRSRRSAPRPSR